MRVPGAEADGSPNSMGGAPSTRGGAPRRWGGAPISGSSSVNRLPCGDLLNARFVMGFVLLMLLFKKSLKTNTEMVFAPKTRESLGYLVEETCPLDSFIQT